MIKVHKKCIDTLSKCYAVSTLNFSGKDHLLVAAEKQDACNLYDLEGNKVSSVWDGPGGTMSIVPLSDFDGEFLATQKFYSPNDSAQSCIVHVKPKNNGAEWEVKKLLDMPFLHRFDILERNGYRYLILCTIKSEHHHKDDWSSPGKVYAVVLPNPFNPANVREEDLHITCIKDGLTKNHGYTKDIHNGVQTAIISAENGVFRFTPPEQPSGDWGIEQLINTPASDAIMADLNADGKKELLVISPFHGDALAIYECKDGVYVKVYDYPEAAEFSHAIERATVAGKEYVFIGHRKGAKRLLAFYYDSEKGCYAADMLDENTGAANACFFKRNGKDCLAVTNREIDEIAVYEFLS
ncbi:hypothetical protein DWQ65_12645 [Treponema phagedenis]|uniref:FG-GAP repeat protein n=1 Tax=Treponema phagedenis TaxID=162 RepID=A0A0B7GQC8_TREPH|nr:hypothetical protein [Treponema phagedenis]NVP23363.1 hypothetical protein [Treponema phagedenis]QEJ95585.1 hypothetical protein FUT79_10460 [Treponema phagedenis]QEJ98507.1 hypothetical protein FUT82_11210 [Treponema phagedenis]QEK01437.1 hypothetical protein FUT84_09930 [Treponema phagedenis]QEK04014.1 hypothetical protein FUT83_09505 [Treponema phagedenis]